MIEKIQSQRTYRYAVSGNPTAKNLLYVLHGYGHLAPYFIRKFNSLEDSFIVAPEGMYRFYLYGSSGRVGACWMTKEERLDDALDFYSMHGFRTVSYFSKHDICIETLIDSMNHLK
jgi:hypothetical protein